MRYMMLIYSHESPQERTPEESQQIMERHWAVINDATRRGVLHGCEPLAPTSTATTVRIQNGKAMMTDGPFAETKEQLAGYYIIDCKDLDEALEWAARIPVCCRGREGCVEVRPMPGLPAREPAAVGAAAQNHNG
ncbi:MAG TPA: YciI family protein [Candidatus Acidoferrales bacterium]|nr:YciI family protein [Candidatus Acidoferrales bacterium]